MYVLQSNIVYYNTYVLLIRIVSGGAQVVATLSGIMSSLSKQCIIDKIILSVIVVQRLRGNT